MALRSEKSVRRRTVRRQLASTWLTEIVFHECFPLYIQLHNTSLFSRYQTRSRLQCDFLFGRDAPNATVPSVTTMCTIYNVTMYETFHSSSMRVYISSNRYASPIHRLKVSTVKRWTWFIGKRCHAKYLEVDLAFSLSIQVQLYYTSARVDTVRYVYNTLIYIRSVFP